MARIDANIATQVGDWTRPNQTARDGDAQAKQAQVKEVQGDEPRMLSTPSAEEVKAAAARLKTVIETASGRQLDFAVNERFKELIVQVKDSKSGEVLKEIPSKEFMDLRERLNDLIGMFIDEKA
jgi:uncharacterized FlaG/YvyC family protein